MTSTEYSSLWRYITAYFALALTSFLWIAENPAAVHSPFLAACFPFRSPSMVFTFLGLPLGKGAACRSFVSGPQAAPTLNRIAIDPIFTADLILTFSCGYLLSNLFFQLLAVVQHSFLPDITIPPDVVLLFSYIRGLFVYCPFLRVRFRNALTSIHSFFQVGCVLRGALFCYF